MSHPAAHSIAAHPLGPLAGNLTHLSRYRLGQDAMHQGFRLSRSGRHEQAAKMFQVGADVATTLATATASIRVNDEIVDPGRVRRWKLVATVRAQFAATSLAAASLNPDRGAVVIAA